MCKTPIISIITVCYNSEKTIFDTIKSVKEQSYSNIEYIVIDGNSTDSTKEIIKKESNFIDHFVSENDNGLYDAMNKGIKLATGEIIGILNSDDIYYNKNVISKINDCFLNFDVDAVYGDLVYTNYDFKKILRYWQSKEFRKKNFKYGWMPPHPSFFVKRSVYERYGLFNTDFKFSADYEFMLRVLYKNNIKVHYLNHILVKMRVGGHSNSSITSRIKSNLEDKKAWKINNIKTHKRTFILKPLSKIFQFFTKPKIVNE